MSKKKILILNAQVDFWGASRSCLSSAIALKEAGYDVMMLATWRGPIAPVVEENGIEFEVCGYHTWMSWPIKQNFQKIRRLKRAAKLIWDSICDFRRVKKKLGDLNYKPDLIYSNTIMQPMGLMLSAYWGVPHIYHIREYGRADFGMYPTLGEKITFYLANKYTEKAVCISKGVQREWSRCFGEKTVLLYNGIPVKNTELTPHSHVTGSLRILIVGRISQEKGQQEVIEALAEIRTKKRLKGISLDLYGEGVDTDMLKSMTQKLGINTIVNFCGFSHNVPYDKYDIAIMSSRCEGFGRTTIEYMLNKVPVIGYNGGATPELIIDGQTGKLYSSTSELVDNIVAAYHSYEQYRQYAEEAYKRAINEFSEDFYRSHLVHIIKSITF